MEMDQEPQNATAISILDFKIKRRLGEGAFGTVYLCRREKEQPKKNTINTDYSSIKKSTKRNTTDTEKKNSKNDIKKSDDLVAIKVIPHVEMKRTDCKQEIQIHAQLAHPNIITFLYHFADHYCTYIVMEYTMCGNLYQLIQREPTGYFSEPLAAHFINDIAAALNYCHEMGVMHRDVKLENCLVISNTTSNIAADTSNVPMERVLGRQDSSLPPFIKLADFGWATTEKTSSLVCGSVAYMSPEMILEELEYDYRVDNWALGVISFELLAGRLPWTIGSPPETKKEIVQCNIVYPDYFTDAAKTFISTLLVKERPYSIFEIRCYDGNCFNDGFNNFL